MAETGAPTACNPLPPARGNTTPDDILMSIVLLAGGFTYAEIGKRLPVLRDVVTLTPIVLSRMS